MHMRTVFFGFCQQSSAIFTAATESMYLFLEVSKFIHFKQISISRLFSVCPFIRPFLTLCFGIVHLILDSLISVSWLDLCSFDLFSSTAQWFSAPLLRSSLFFFIFIPSTHGRICSSSLVFHLSQRNH